MLGTVVFMSVCGHGTIPNLYVKVIIRFEVQMWKLNAGGYFTVQESTHDQSMQEVVRIESSRALGSM